jgi:CspA family cold shock protein
MRGTIKKIVMERGFGFITPDGGGGDIFFHCTSLPEKSDFDGLSEGQNVSFEKGEGKGGRPKAEDVVVTGSCS